MSSLYLNEDCRLIRCRVRESLRVENGLSKNNIAIKKSDERHMCVPSRTNRGKKLFYNAMNHVVRACEKEENLPTVFDCNR